VYGSQPLPGSSPLERPGLDKITGQPWSDTTCPCTTARSTWSCLFKQKERHKAEECFKRWETRGIVASCVDCG